MQFLVQSISSKQRDLKQDFEFKSISMQESTRPINKKVKRGGQYCVAGLPNGESCTNSSLTPGISMHRFPSKNLDLRRQWIRFVRRHRANFNHQAYSIGPYLCSDHFERSCYEKPFALELPGFDSSKTKRTLKKDGIPTVFDTRGRSQAFSESSSKVARNRRTLLRGIKQHEHANKNECASGQFDEEIEEVEVGENAFTIGDSFTIGEQHNDSEEHVDVVPLQCQVHLTGAPVHTCPTCITPQREEVQGNIRTHTAIQVAMMCKKCTETRKKIQNLRRQNNRLKHVIRTLREGSEKNEDSGNPIPVEDILHAEESNENLSEDEDSEWKVDEADSSPGDMSDSDGTDFDDYDYDDTHKKRQQVRIDQNATPEKEPKFIVFYTMLLQVFSILCFKCKKTKPGVRMEQNGTMVTVYQSCIECGKDCWKWRSQPYVLGRYPAGNILLSLSTLTAGASISKLLLIFRHFGLATYSAHTFFRHQKKFVFPAILRHWELYRASLLTELHGVKDIVLCGDGRFDSMGHSAKYGTYTMYCDNIKKIIHFELVQSNECKGSSNMELLGAKRCFGYLNDAGIEVSNFISDRHRGVAKWIRESLPHVHHYYDIWHVARTLTKKVTIASKERNCEILGTWCSTIRNHLYWCATSTKEGFGKLIVAKWKAFSNHIQNKHNNHEDKLFQRCAHGELDHKRRWILNGTTAYDKIQPILMNQSLLQDIAKLSSNAQTSCLEGYHSTLNQWHPKMTHYSWIGSLCRHIMAVSHFNENLHREAQKDKNGKEYFKVSYPKYKLGEEAVKPVPVPPSYNYVEHTK
ncbi:uncharacterized protein LOC135692760 isoform X2 [Rhopilema esculentum]|uniref:uncharacterized protein LOC135692695 isoform X2 n=1 Tax=Rhopilema esculentum TaxID=499914 RepID=UPI0031DCC8B5